MHYVKELRVVDRALIQMGCMWQCYPLWRVNEEGDGFNNSPSSQLEICICAQKQNCRLLASCLGWGATHLTLNIYSGIPQPVT